ncbi:hypothetical protein ABVN80_14385 [Acinetobacter baumannii]
MSELPKGVKPKQIAQKIPTHGQETAACADGAKVAMLAAVKIAAATTNNADLCLPCIFRIVF